MDGDKPKRSRFRAYPIGCFHIDIAQVSTEEGKLHLLVAIDRFTDNRPVNEEVEVVAAAYWAERDAPRIDRWHAFDWACEQARIEHRLTKPRCPWTNGHVEWMNRTVKDATVKR